MEMDKKTMVGAVLGITLIGVLIWILFFRKKSDGKPLLNVLPKKTPDQNTGTSQKTAIATNAGSFVAQNLFPMSKGSSSQYVGVLQQALKDAGLYKLSIDNSWGNGTQEAFKKAFPNAVGVQDLKDLEAKVAQLKQGVVNTSASSSNIIKYDPKYKDKRYRFVVTTTPKEFPNDNAPNASDPYTVGDVVGLTGRWANVGGVNWSEFERYGARGKAWVKDSAIQPK
jgi:hypothetical protein